MFYDLIFETFFPIRKIGHTKNLCPHHSPKLVSKVHFCIAKDIYCFPLLKYRCCDYHLHHLHYWAAVVAGLSTAIVIVGPQAAAVVGLPSSCIFCVRLHSLIDNSTLNFFFFISIIKFRLIYIILYTYVYMCICVCRFG